MLSEHRIRARHVGANLALALLPGAATADSDVREPRRAAEILESIDDPAEEPSWISHIRIKKKHGLP